MAGRGAGRACRVCIVVSTCPAALAGILARRLLLALAAVCALVLFPWAGSASAASGLRVTYVARVCPAYEDIYANRARNDIQESLQDLGMDSPYPDGDFLVNPDVEGGGPQAKCQPLVDWRFTLGTGFESKAVHGPWGSLSRVTNPYTTVIQTKALTPLLNQNGDQIKNDTIAGAVTVELTSDQVQQASNRDSLWAQGGVPDDPVLAGPFPGPKYGFGALRCAVDALNGDNVEFIFFPTGVTHVFCYALYVSPPPTAGTITIEKRVSGAPAGENPAFPFTGNLSFDPGGFQLSDNESADFVRAGGATWDVTEGSVDNYALSSVDCSATTQGTGSPMSTWTAGATTSITLVAGEHVTCVYNNKYVSPAGGLTISKITRGGKGSFDYAVTGDGGSHSLRATTIAPNVPVDAVPSPLSLAPGTYTIREQQPASPDGTWRLVSVSCNGEAVTARPVQVEVHSGQGSVCTFVNAFTPRGSISIAKVTFGATGTATFLVNPNAPPLAQFLQHATTTQEGVPTDAKPASAADATDHLLLGAYTIVEQSPPAVHAGHWTLSSVICGGVVQPFDQGAVTVRLTQSEPSVHCQFTNVYSPKPPPDPLPVVPTTPPPNPLGGGASPEPIYPITDLDVSKQASSSTVVLGQVVTYRITARNISHVTAQRVAVSDQTLGRVKVLDIHNPAGTCRTHPQPICQLGNLKPGAKVVITVRAMPESIRSHFVNRVAVGSATDETNLSNNTAQATVRVLPPPRAPSGLG